MSNTSLAFKFGIFCLCTVVAVLIFSPTALADSVTPESPPAPIPTISSVQFIATAGGPLDAAVVNCNGEIFAPQNAAFEERVIELVNEARTENNLPPLKSSDELNNATRYHARDMAEDEYFSHHTHDRVNGELALICAWNARIRLYYGDYLRLGENIARGYPTPESVFQAWMDSEGHRSNILNPDYREIGVGYYDTYWSQVFGEREDVYPLIINQDSSETDSQNINIYAYGEWDQMRLRNDSGQWSEWRTFEHNFDWTLAAVAGSRTVEAEMRDSSATAISSDSINFVGDSDDDGSGDQPTPHAVNALIFLPVVTR